VPFPDKIDLASDNAFCACAAGFCCHVVLRAFFFAFEVRFLGTAIIKEIKNYKVGEKLFFVFKQKLFFV
jgi:hypothetical protein